MLYFDGIGGLIFVALWIWCFIDVLLTPEMACRNLPKLAWIFIVLLFPLIGSIAWLVAGRAVGPHRSARQSAAQRHRRRVPFPGVRPAEPAGCHQPGRRRGVPRQPRKRAEEQRRRAREQGAREGRDRRRPA